MKTLIDHATFPERLKERRGDLSQREFGLLVGTTEQAIGKWERGECIPATIAARDKLRELGVECPPSPRRGRGR